MPLSYAQYPGNGSTRDFSVPFPYLLRSHVRVFIGYDPAADTWSSELFEGSGFAWISGTLIRTTTAPSGTQRLSVVRKTPATALIVQWQDGSNFSAQDLLPSDLQNLYVVQELQDRSDAVAVQARSAIDTANAILAAASSFIAYQLVANVAAIPSSPANNTFVEVADSAGIESFTPLAGRPGGFTGSAGLSVRLRYTTSGATWNWLMYFPNDPENRYLSFAGGTLAGALTLPGNPQSNLQAAPKQYVDSGDYSNATAIAAVQATANNAMPRAGGTFTGNVTFSATQAIPVAGIPDGGIGTAKMADGFLAATTAGRLKMADLFVTTAKLADAVLSADASGLAKMADGFLAATTAGRLKMADLFVTTAKVGDAQITPAKLSQPLTLGTAQNSTSGTSIDFTGIPNWARRIQVLFNEVSTNGTSLLLIRVGSTTFSTSGYKSTASYGAATANQYAASTAGFVLDTTSKSAAQTLSGVFTLTLVASSTWAGSGCIGGDQAALIAYACAGISPALSGALDRIRITTVNGTDTFDAGSINVLYDG